MYIAINCKLDKVIIIAAIKMKSTWASANPQRSQLQNI